MSAARCLAEVDGNVDGGSLTVGALGENTSLATTTSFQIGGLNFAGSATFAQVTDQADVTAKVGSSALVRNNVSVTAGSTNTATSISDAASGGLLGAISINLPRAEVGGGTLAQFDGDVVSGTSVTISSTSANHATATAEIFSIGGIVSGAGASATADVTGAASTKALVGQTASFDAPGVTINVSATSADTADATANGKSGSIGLSVVEMIPTALVGGVTQAGFDGDITNAAGLTVQSRTANVATAKTHVTNIGLLGSVSGAIPHAEVTSSSHGEASIGQHATISVTGSVLVDAGQTMPNTATAKADGGSFGLIDAGVFASNAHVGGSVLAQMDGHVTAADLTVTATGGNTASATTESFGLGVGVHFTASSTFASVDSSAGVGAEVGSTASISTSGAISVTSNSTNNATATSDAAGGSLVASVGVALPTAKVGGSTYAGFDGAVTQAGSLTISATSANTAGATSDDFSIGLLGSFAVASSDAEVTADATTRADVGGTANISMPGGAITVGATGNGVAHASSQHSGGGLLAFSVMLPTASVGGGVLTSFDGHVADAGSLLVQAAGQNTATSYAAIATLSLAGGQGAFADASVTSDAATQALVGSGASIATSGAVVVQAQLYGTKNTADAHAEGLSGGLIFSGSMMGSRGTVDAAVRARLDGTVTQSSAVTLDAEGRNRATANTDVASIGAFSGAGAGADAEIGANADVEAGTGGSITTSGLLHVRAIADNQANADSSAGSGGLVGIGAALPIAQAAGGTLAEVNGGVTGASGINIEAGSTNIATGHAGVLAIGLFGGAGASASANVTGDATTDANIGANALINSPAAAINVTAAGGNAANAIAGVGAGGVISVALGDPVAHNDGRTGVQVLGSINGGSSSLAGAASLTVQATGTDTTSATVSSGSGGLLTVSSSTANATTNSTASGTFGGGSTLIVVSGNIHFGVTDDTDADSSSHGGSGGLVRISNFHSHVTLTPHVTLSIGDGAQIIAGGLIELQVIHSHLPDPVSDGTFNAGTDVSTADDTITFSLKHNLHTGDVVTYDRRGQAGIGGLESGRQYGVIIPDTNGTKAIELGSVFSSALVDTVHNTISFGDNVGSASVSAPHNLQTGDFVYYVAPAGSTSVGGLISGHRYEVNVIDNVTIKLKDPAVSRTDVSVGLIGPELIDTTNDKIVASNDFQDGDLITYRAPAPDFSFNSGVVDVAEDGSGNLARSGSSILDVPGADNVYYPDHGLSSGAQIVYRDGTHPIGLASGATYYAINVDSNVFQVADSYCHAVGGVADPTNCTDDHGTADTSDDTPIPVTPLALTPDKSTDGKLAPQTFRFPRNLPIGGLTSGENYYVVNASSSDFQLSTTMGGSAVDLTTSTYPFPGAHTFRLEGVDLTSVGSGGQNLILDLTSAGSGTQQMLGVGGPQGLNSAPSGDRIVTASSSGSGGGLIDVGSSDANATATPTTSITIGSAKLSGGTITVTTDSLTNVVGSAQNGGGGLVSVGQANASGTGGSDNSITIQGGAELTSLGDLTVAGTSHVNAQALAASSNVGLGSGVNTNTHVYVTFNVRTFVNGALKAGGTLLVESHTFTDAYSSADSNAGGLGADANADSRVSMGGDPGSSVSDPCGGAGMTCVDIQGGARLTGGRVEVNAIGDHIKANAHAHEHATALGANSDATGNTDVRTTARVILETGSRIVGDDSGHIRANQFLDLDATPSANCSCLGGDTDSTANIDFNGESQVIGRVDAFIRSSDLTVEANVFVTHWNRDPNRDGATFDSGGSHGDSHFNARREIFWEAHVVVADKNPQVVVDSTGKITSLVNATVFDGSDINTHGPALAVGDSIAPGHLIWVDDMVNTHGGGLKFLANDTAGQNGSPSTPYAGEIWGNHGVVEIQETWEFVKVWNFSDRALVTHNIKVFNETPGHVGVEVHVDQIDGPTDTPPNNVSLDETVLGNTFEFDIKHTFPPTYVHIANFKSGAIGDSNVILDGQIENPIGKTRLENEGGDIVFGPHDPGKVVRTNILEIDADKGSAGLLVPTRAPLSVELVRSEYTDDTGTHQREIVLNADVSVDLVLDIRSILREVPPVSAPYFTPHLGPIHVGHDADLFVYDSIFGTDLNTNLGSVAVALFDPPSATPSPDSAGLVPEPLPARHRRHDAGPDPARLRQRPARPDRQRLHVHRPERGPHHPCLPYVDRHDDHVHGLQQRRRHAARRRHGRPRHERGQERPDRPLDERLDPRHRDLERPARRRDRLDGLRCDSALPGRDPRCRARRRRARHRSDADGRRRAEHHDGRGEQLDRRRLGTRRHRPAVRLPRDPRECGRRRSRRAERVRHRGRRPGRVRPDPAARHATGGCEHVRHLHQRVDRRHADRHRPLEGQRLACDLRRLAARRAERRPGR